MTTTTQQPPPLPPPPLPGFSTRFRPSFPITIMLLATTFLLATVLFIYCRRQHRYHAHNHRHHRLLLPTRFHIESRGLDPDILSSFPVLLYSDVRAHKHPLDCAVCLCGFDDHGSLTLLPSCNHAFHPDCIAMWLASHITCPVCRRDLSVPEPPDGSHHDDNVDEVAEREVGRKRGERWWSEEDRERFRLVLPEEVRMEVIGRSASARVVGGIRGMSWRWDRAVMSERWLARTFSSVWSSHGDPDSVHDDQADRIELGRGEPVHGADDQTTVRRV